MSRRRGTAAILLALALLVGCAPAAPPPQLRPAPLPLVVDTDMGVDDVLALLYLLERPDVDLLAVTVAGTGITRCDSGIGLADALLAAAGREEVPVACGRATPLEGDHAFPPSWRDGAAAAYGLPLQVDLAPTFAGASETLRAATTEGPLTVLALGPLTNLGEALRADPGLGARIERLVVMGGALDVPGNLGNVVVDNAAAEWNMYLDPTAADIVLRSSVRVDLVPLDATNALPVTPAFARRLAREGATPAAELAARLLEGQLGADAGELYHWDPLAAALAVDAGLAPWAERRIAVVTADGPESGRTALDDAGAEVRVAGAPGLAAFEQHFLDSLNGRFAGQGTQP